MKSSTEERVVCEEVRSGIAAVVGRLCKRLKEYWVDMETVMP